MDDSDGHDLQIMSLISKFFVQGTPKKKTVTNVTGIVETMWTEKWTALVWTPAATSQEQTIQWYKTPSFAIGDHSVFQLCWAPGVIQKLVME
jgi:hypothetical protein